MLRGHLREDALDRTGRYVRADGVPGIVPVRDSKVTDGPVLLVGALAWAEFVGAVV
ncbi:DUF397 domain-containing protein [Streptomyces sp. NBC_01390]|uniref:DUF397 domain-containing protein n=1 Tax=Streptomyces sp. NBC_01390 TaxID=2903850 RepID=UPI0038674A0E